MKIQAPRTHPHCQSIPHFPRPFIEPFPEPFSEPLLNHSESHSPNHYPNHSLSHSIKPVHKPFPKSLPKAFVKLMEVSLLESNLPINPFQMLNFHQSLPCRIGLHIIKIPRVSTTLSPNPVQWNIGTWWWGHWLYFKNVKPMHWTWWM